MGTFIKSIDPNHLVGVGDEGFFCNPKLPYNEVNCEHGVDSVTFSQSPAIDAVGFHLYPDAWSQSMAWVCFLMIEQRFGRRIWLESLFIWGSSERWRETYEIRLMLTGPTACFFRAAVERLFGLSRLTTSIRLSPLFGTFSRAWSRPL